MALEQVGKILVKSDDSVRTDLKTQVVGSTTANLLDVDASGRTTAKLADGAGTALLSSTGKLQIDVSAQGLAALKVSRDGATPAATNGVYSELTVSNAVLNPGNPVPVHLSNGTVSIGGTAAGPVSVRFSNGTAYNAEATPIFVELAEAGTNLGMGNPLWTRLTDGTAAFGTETNPVYTTPVADITPGTVIRQHNLAAAVADAGASNHDYTVTTAKTLELAEVTVSSPDAATFAIIFDASGASPETVATIFLAPGSTVHTMTFSPRKTLAAAKVLRIQRTNRAGAAKDLASMWTGFEV